MLGECGVYVFVFVLVAGYPIFVFGYSQLARGISYRSKKRVPSHMILLYGTSMSICRLVQAAGRSLGEQATPLRANGFAHVTLLTLAHDFDTIRYARARARPRPHARTPARVHCHRNYPDFLEAIRAKMVNDGISLRDALEARQAGR